MWHRIEQCGKVSLTLEVKNQHHSPFNRSSYSINKIYRIRTLITAMRMHFSLSLLLCIALYWKFDCRVCVHCLLCYWKVAFKWYFARIAYWTEISRMCCEMLKSWKQLVSTENSNRGQKYGLEWRRSGGTAASTAAAVTALWQEAHENYARQVTHALVQPSSYSSWKQCRKKWAELSAREEESKSARERNRGKGWYWSYNLDRR